MNPIECEIPRSAAGFGTAALSYEAGLWLLVLALAALGTVMVYSASSVIALKRFADPYFFLKKQMVVVTLGLALVWAFSRIPYRFYQHLSKPGLVAVIAALALVWIPALGVELNGARRWFRIGLLHVQPSEYAKVAWLVYLSSYCNRKQERVRDFRAGFLPPVLVLALLAFLLMIEPDFGTTVILAVLTLLLLFAAGARWRYLAVLLLPAAAGFYLFVYLSPYRWVRVVTFWNPWTSPLTSGYQLIQSWIAVGSGGILGKGLGAGHQKLFYLPEPFTDFIFAVIGEELGLLGITVVVVLFAALIWTGIRVSQNAPDSLGSYLALGIAGLFFIESFLNMGVVLGLLPTKGLALPFVSYGGSSFTANCVAAGVLINVARATEKVIR